MALGTYAPLVGLLLVVLVIVLTARSIRVVEAPE